MNLLIRFNYVLQWAFVSPRSSSVLPFVLVMSLFYSLWLLCMLNAHIVTTLTSTTKQSLGNWIEKLQIHMVSCISKYSNCSGILSKYIKSQLWDYGWTRDKDWSHMIKACCASTVHSIIMTHLILMFCTWTITYAIKFTLKLWKLVYFFLPTTTWIIHHFAQFNDFFPS